MLVESKETVWLRWNPKQRWRRTTEERCRQRSRLVGSGRTSSCELSGLASFETLVRSPHLDHEGWLRWSYDTGTAISAFPLDVKIGTETQAKECSYKTASGELISDRGGLRVQGTTEYGYGLTFQGRKADVHKTVISASNVHRCCSCRFEWRLHHSLQQHTCEKDSTIRST